MPLTPAYPTLAEAEAAVAVLGTALVNRQLNTPEELNASWIVAGYGLSLGFGTPPSVGKSATQKTALMAPVKGATSFNWMQLIQLIIQMIGALQPTP